MNKKTVLRLTLIILSQILLTCGGTALAYLPVKEIKIPANLGIIKETFELPASSSGTNRVIIHIQDAHCNYEAQKNLAQILEYLVKNYNLKLVLVEGGSGNVNLSFLRGYADKDTREKVADKYLKMGKISGEEYLDIVSNYNLDIYGIDDPVLYDKHLAVFWNVDSIKGEGVKYLENLSAVVESLKDKMYSDELKELERKNAAYKDKTLALADYCRFLKEKAGQKGVDLQVYPNLVNFAETARLEKEIDFDKAESERNLFIKELAKFLDEKSVEILIGKTQEFKEGKETPHGYYSFLKNLAENKIDLQQAYPHLNNYIVYLNVSKDIDTAGLVKEVSAIEEAIKTASFVTDEQRRIDRISKTVRILTAFLNLELTPEDYAYFTANREQFLTASWKDFLSGLCAKYNVAMEINRPAVIDGNLKQLEEFYQLGMAREQAFVGNIQKKMDESNEQLAVLITGGFHTPGITPLLKEKGYSYIVAAPVITQKGDSSVYFAALRNEMAGAEDFSDEEE